MNKFETQRRADFISDLKSLCSHYGWTLDEAMFAIGFKQKTMGELLVDEAKEKYKAGVVFIPLDKVESKIGSSREPEFLFDRVWVWAEKNKMCCVWKDGVWAEIVE